MRTAEEIKEQAIKEIFEYRQLHSETYKQACREVIEKYEMLRSLTHTEGEEETKLFKYSDADCCSGILKLEDGSYKCNDCGAFYGVDWKDGQTHLKGELKPL